MSDAVALVVDDEPDIRELVQLTLQRMQIPSDAAADLAEARERLRGGRYQLCLTDMRLPDGCGLDLVRHMQKQHPEIPVAVITAHGNMESAVEALKAGAFDFVAKPVDLAVLRKLVGTALKLNTQPVQDRRSRDTLLGDSAPMRRIRSLIHKVSRSQAPVYIGGESGTGKELVARLIHEKGPRREKPFVPVNCGAIPGELMESEFFGHRKGSFTGATTDKPGLFQAADGGTLFLDEVAELPLAMQVKLLRAIQEKAVRPVGEQQEVSVDVRVLSATHKDLSELVDSGQFRQDLYYRINVIQLQVPPLRERREDIPMLVEHVLGRLDEGGRHALSDAALAALRGHAFPGNVRELENILERALTLAEGVEIAEEDLLLPETTNAAMAEGDHTPPLPEPDDEFQLEHYIEHMERELIVKALEKTRYNKTAAAGLLGISFRALRYRLKKLGID
ncbi:sigma-54-dependent transcriptional regulator [Alkalilimnicola sp. S0819]|uniref:sigma-54-dependent transcriptional regulator n=1 Tax=Alkalilimnicola sp. S0819 TaxID=2613922 RepID=UPI001261AB3F|nr:sigma-54 dependent transcriptional regulator [Alkalilimnicola sp. S0819]KAB7623796.1 sigma-54-dependent Fis family transcriptional regulator [Alkalilimnicola sp. S0819]MPQ16670.1 response regulator [Alkalilimnicola sp. S0819]